MALNPPEQDLVGDTKSILQWYDTSRPLFIDLVGDYAGKELFLVEGDSMLRECFADERIDFQGTYLPRSLMWVAHLKFLSILSMSTLCLEIVL